MGSPGRILIRNLFSEPAFDPRPICILILAGRQSENQKHGPKLNTEDCLVFRLELGTLRLSTRYRFVSKRRQGTDASRWSMAETCVWSSRPSSLAEQTSVHFRGETDAECPNVSS